MPTADPSIEAGGWTLAARAIPLGVQIELAMPGRGLTAGIAMTGEEARAFARGLLAAAGDATERTFPRPPIAETEE